MKHTTAALLAIALLATAAAAATKTPAKSAPAAKVVATETLPTGIVVQHTKIGTGPSPTATDTVEVNYRGTFGNGREFDSSRKLGKPVSFALNGVIPCWTQGLQKMKVGGSAMLTCPPYTAYGKHGVPDTVPPNATLHFDVELLAIKK